MHGMLIRATTQDQSTPMKCLFQLLVSCFCMECAWRDDMQGSGKRIPRQPSLVEIEGHCGLVKRDLTTSVSEDIPPPPPGFLINSPYAPLYQR